MAVTAGRDPGPPTPEEMVERVRLHDPTDHPDSEPLYALIALRDLRRYVSANEVPLVWHCRQKGWSWDTIARALGYSSRQSVWRHFRAVDGASTPSEAIARVGSRRVDA